MVLKPIFNTTIITQKLYIQSKQYIVFIIDPALNFYLKTKIWELENFSITF